MVATWALRNLFPALFSSQPFLEFSFRFSWFCCFFYFGGDRVSGANSGFVSCVRKRTKNASFRSQSIGLTGNWGKERDREERNLIIFFDVSIRCDSNRLEAFWYFFFYYFRCFRKSKRVEGEKQRINQLDGTTEECCGHLRHTLLTSSLSLLTYITPPSFRKDDAVKKKRQRLWVIFFFAENKNRSSWDNNEKLLSN